MGQAWTKTSQKESSSPRRRRKAVASVRLPSRSRSASSSLLFFAVTMVKGPAVLVRPM